MPQMMAILHIRLLFFMSFVLSLNPTFISNYTVIIWFELKNKSLFNSFVLKTKTLFNLKK